MAGNLGRGWWVWDPLNWTVKLVFVLGGGGLPNVTPNIWDTPWLYTLSNDIFFWIHFTGSLFFYMFFFLEIDSNIPKFLGESADMAHSWKCLIEAWMGKKRIIEVQMFNWVVATQIFLVFIPIWGRWTQFWLKFFQRGWNHQLVKDNTCKVCFFLFFGGFHFCGQRNQVFPNKYLTSFI